MAARTKKKRTTTKMIKGEVWSDASWVVKNGVLKRGRGRPVKVDRLFEVVAEKLPKESLDKVEAHIQEHQMGTSGVYAAHDSMGSVRT